MAIINHRLTRDALAITFARPAVALCQSGKIFDHRNILNSSSILKRTSTVFYAALPVRVK